jgi:hypothetical protein
VKLFLYHAVDTSNVVRLNNWLRDGGEVASFVYR